MATLLVLHSELSSELSTQGSAFLHLKIAREGWGGRAGQPGQGHSSPCSVSVPVPSQHTGQREGSAGTGSSSCSATAGRAHLAQDTHLSTTEQQPGFGIRCQRWHCPQSLAQTPSKPGTRAGQGSLGEAFPAQGFLGSVKGQYLHVLLPEHLQQDPDSA